jgi:hypothetical protein
MLHLSLEGDPAIGHRHADRGLVDAWVPASTPVTAWASSTAAWRGLKLSTLPRRVTTPALANTAMAWS